jgi:hypothetical protein
MLKSARNGRLLQTHLRRMGKKVRLEDRRVDIVSESVITFHNLRTVEQIKRHQAIIYDSCPIGTVLHTAVQKSRVAVIVRR